ncbi:GNAT family protein [Fodinicurvata sp. EGI_FJ10296]|uniref:GNAT family N-acetyltransferase n=1 Tax=Fodinicurvata sp. EGI_FJ10296 TaxID=3231908 RepID=UPI003453E902
MADLRNWRGVPGPERKALEGVYVRLEPLDPAKHSAHLYEAAAAPGADERFRYLYETPPSDLDDLRGWVEKVSAGSDPLVFAVIDKNTGRAEGRQSFMRIDTANGVIEIGGIMWGPAIARTRVATEALFLFADYAFGLGYRRFEWKCNNLNVPSKRAAERFGFQFEGVFRQHLVVKGLNRDTAWFSIIDSEWPQLRAGYEGWLGADNFDATGGQLSKLKFDR